MKKFVVVWLLVLLVLSFTACSEEAVYGFVGPAPEITEVPTETTTENETDEETTEFIEDMESLETNSNTTQAKETTTKPTTTKPITTTTTTQSATTTEPEPSATAEAVTDSTEE